jgi:hypothetical protein
MTDPFDLKLRTHKLSGKLKGLWSFSLDYNLRVVFYFTIDNPKKAVLVDVGTHNEVYSATYTPFCFSCLHEAFAAPTNCSLF